MDLKRIRKNVKEDFSLHYDRIQEEKILSMVAGIGIYDRKKQFLNLFRDKKLWVFRRG
ncbi:MAG: hypothetical protein ACK4UJ_03150 [Leptonema sp. (in: bacteria)]